MLTILDIKYTHCTKIYRTSQSRDFNVLFFYECDLSGIGQARPQLQATLMQRMTDVLSRMLNDPMTRAALSAGGEDSLDQDAQRQDESNAASTNETSSAATAENSNPQSSTTAATAK